MNLEKLLKLIRQYLIWSIQYQATLITKKHNIGILLDLRKPLTQIDHQILIRKLQCYGIRGIACDWFKSYHEKSTICII